LGAEVDGPLTTNASARSDETLDSLQLGLLACCQLLVALVAQALAALLVDQIRQVHVRGAASAPSPFTPQELLTLTYAAARAC
jgi:hypothetical protein